MNLSAFLCTAVGPSGEAHPLTVPAVNAQAALAQARETCPWATRVSGARALAGNGLDKFGRPV